MFRALATFLAICMLPETGHAQDRVRPAIERIVPLLERAAAGSADQRECFTCHSQGLPILALTEARLHSFNVDEANWQRQLDHTYAHLNRHQEKYAKGEGTGGKADTAGHALWALATGDRAADETTEAVVEYLLSWQSADDHWSCTSDRPPSEASDFTTTYLALRGLVDYGTDAQQDRIAARTESARDWLIDAAPADTEDRVFRMWALQLAEAEANVVASAASDLVSRQRDDGGWSQLDDQESDVYATATALVALQRTGSLAAGDEAYQRGVEFLLGAQRADGSWHVVSRSNPFQSYYESGFPHGADQFISTTASAWAALALLAVAPEKPAEATAPPESDRKSQSSAIAAIEALGGKITFDERAPGRPALAVILFDNKRVTDMDLRQLRSLSSLVEVVLDGTTITDAGLSHLAPLKNLGSLCVAKTPITGTGLALVKEFPRLEILGLQDTGITDADLVHVQDLNELRMLFLSGTKVTNVGLRHLSRLTNLDTLTLSGTKVSDDGLQHLSALTNLRDLRLNETEVSDAGLEQLVHVTNLKTLVLSTTGITDAGIKHLKEIKTLRSLWIHGTSLSRSAIAELQQALPECEIEHSLSN